MNDSPAPESVEAVFRAASGAPDPSLAVDRVSAYCFVGEQLVLVHHSLTDAWAPPAGAVRADETVNEAACRIVLDTMRMRVTTLKMLGYLEYAEGEHKVLEAITTCTVEPEQDTALSGEPGDIDEVRAVHLSDIRSFLPWTSFLSDILHRARAEQTASDSPL